MAAAAGQRVAGRPGLEFWRAQSNAAERAAVRRCVARDIRIGSHRVSLRFASEQIDAALWPALQHASTDASGEPALTVTVWDTESSGVERAPLPFGPRDLLARGEVAAIDPEVRFLCDPMAPAVTAWHDREREANVWYPSVGRIPAHERACPVRTLLQWALEPRGVHLVHAAAVGDARDGALIAGVSGSGKSTLAVACLQAGLGFAGDDYIGLATGSDPVALSLYATAKLDDASVEILGGLAAVPRGLPLAGGHKQVLRLAPSGAGPVARELPVSVIVLPRVGAPPGLRPASAGQALRALAAPSILQVPQDAATTLGVLSRLVRTVPAYELGAGSDMAAMVDGVEAARRDLAEAPR